MHIPLGFFDNTLHAVDGFLLVGLSVLITSLIAFRLIHAQRRFKSVFPDTNYAVYTGIISILVESAAPVAVFGIASSVSGLYSNKSSQGYQATSIFQILFLNAGVGGTASYLIES